MMNEITNVITINGYQREALRTINPDLTPSQQLENGLIGLVAEGGEALDILKKHLFQGHTMDSRHIASELGDVYWYLAVSAWALGYELDEIANMKHRKLRSRYPGEGFDADRSANRLEGDI